VSVALLGFTKIEQIHENLKALEVMRNWTKETEAKCAAILDNEPVEELDVTTFSMIPNRRKSNLYVKN